MDNMNVEQKNIIRKIEDIIDIQKANGNFNVRQVAFKLPSETDSTISANLVKSLETGLSKVKLDQNHKKIKKLRSKRQKSFTPDVISWPSDSDITVLRMKIRSSTDINDKLGNVVLGDGLHQRNTSSMINLATLIIHSQSPSKHSINMEEYLMPLSSWEHAEQDRKKPETVDENSVTSTNSACHIFRPRCSHKGEFSYRDSDFYEETNTKSKVARFLRLYFCPCCTCLYNLEKMQDKSSGYFTKS
ncbi:uncharacterized protein LOC133318874 [Danaus plexippus]|uniref:Uncharacterized protein n=1 Tax=Danaus plexippus plexippus TaxID=278856 RepID=A0A212EMQ4_DANPL|nr:uncharacterized protein LOC133318874 [Danaus plexippus]OWR42721.1 hypothetical protein KGM_210893 [Danaus plexippus plexippus]